MPILLIAAKRSDQISAEMAAHDFETNVEADRIVNSIHALTAEMHEHICGGGPGGRGVEPPATTPR